MPCRATSSIVAPIESIISCIGTLGTGSGLAPALGFSPTPALASRLGLIPASRLAWAVVEAAAACVGASGAVCAADRALVACVWLAAAKDRPASSAVELGVSLLLDAGEVAAGFWKGAEPAVCVRGEESVVWVALWVCVAALSVLVPGVWVESDWSRDGEVVVSSAVWGITPLGCSASREPDEFGVSPGVGASVALGAVGMGVAA